MDTEIQKFKQLVESSHRILVTSHISPDPDAISSVILLTDTLKDNYSDKTIEAVLEEEPARLNFLHNYQSIKYQPIDEYLESFKPDLFVLLDANNFDRCSRHNGEKVREYLVTNSVQRIIVDHHEPNGADASDVYINQHSPACVQDVYEICFEHLSLSKPAATADTTMVGLYADSGGFIYPKDGSQKKLFSLVNQLLAAGADVEKTKNLLNQFSFDDVKVLSTLLSNAQGADDYTYSFLSDEFINEWSGQGKTYPELQIATSAFLNEFVRNIDGRVWGFIVYKNNLQGENMYSVSFRSVGGAKDVAELAAKLGGGGHKPAAGAKFEAASIKDAIKKVQSIILEP